MERFVASSRCASTPDENWTLERPLTRRLMYAVAADLALEYLGDGNGRTCLVIGSPIYEASLLREHGWDVTFLDVRDPPRHQLPKFIQCDASDMAVVPSESFDAVSSTCVLAHVGLGRYGDPTTGSDVRVMGEIHRVLKPGGRAAITFGNLGPETIRLGTCHRIYSLADVKAMCAKFTIEAERTWDSGESLPENEYVSAFMKK